jgi:hypothetical protein
MPGCHTATTLFRAVVGAFAAVATFSGSFLVTSKKVLVSTLDDQGMRPFAR